MSDPTAELVEMVAVAVGCHQHDDADSEFGHCCVHGEPWVRAWPAHGCAEADRIARHIRTYLRLHPEALR